MVFEVLQISPSLQYYLNSMEKIPFFFPYLSNIIASSSRTVMYAFVYSLLRSDTSASHILLFLVYTDVVFSFSMRSLVYIKLYILNKKRLISFYIYSYKIEINSHYCTRVFLYKKFIIHIYYVKFFAKDGNVYK